MPASKHAPLPNGRTRSTPPVAPLRSAARAPSGCGKRSILLDLATPEGLDLFWRLVEDADVIAENFRADVVERLGVGYEQVRARKPEIVYASINAYGYEGPWAGRPGWEQVAQAATGM